VTLITLDKDKDKLPHAGLHHVKPMVSPKPGKQIAPHLTSAHARSFSFPWFGTHTGSVKGIGHGIPGWTGARCTLAASQFVYAGRVLDHPASVRRFNLLHRREREQESKVPSFCGYGVQEITGGFVQRCMREWRFLACSSRGSFHLTESSG